MEAKPRMLASFKRLSLIIFITILFVLSAQTATAYTSGYTFTRDTIAYYPDYTIAPINTPRMWGTDDTPGILIEEATTNLLTNTDSIELSAEKSITVTSGQKHTVSINGVYGSIELSNAGIGTVIPGTPVTITAGSTTLTLSPSQTSDTWPAYVQVENKAFNTSWTLGGITRNKDTCTISTNGLSASQGSIELTLYVNNDIIDTSANHYVFSHSTNSGNNNRINFLHHSTNGWQFIVANNTGSSSNVITGAALTTGWHKFGMSWDSSTLLLTIDGGEPLTTPNPRIPATINTVAYIGSMFGGSQSNTYIGEMMISNIARSDLVTRAALPQLTPDENTVFYNSYNFTMQQNINENATSSTLYELTDSYYDSYNINGITLNIPSNTMINGNEAIFTNISLNITNSNNILLEHINNNDFYMLGAYALGVYGTCDNITIYDYNVYTSRSRNPAINFIANNMSNITLNNINIDDTDNSGVVFDTVNRNIITNYANINIINSAINKAGYNTRVSDYTVGFDLAEGGNNFTVTNMLVKNCISTYSWESGFHMEGGSKIVNTTIIDCTSNNNGIKGITSRFGAGFHLHNVTINNSIANNNYVGVDFQNDTLPNALSYNTLINTNISDSVLAGIRLKNSTLGNTIIDNVIITGDTGTGIINDNEGTHELGVYVDTVNVIINPRSSGTLTFKSHNPIAVTLNTTTESVIEADTTITVNINVSNLTYWPVAELNTLDGSALAGLDYVAISNQEIDYNTANVILSIKDNAIPLYGTKQFCVSLSDPTGGATLGEPNNTTITIYNMAVNFASNISGVEGADITGTIELYPEALPFDSSVTITSTDGTAKAGLDYTAINQVVTILAGETSGTFAIHLNYDEFQEGIETFNLTISNPINATIGTNSTCVVKISEIKTGAKYVDDNVSITMTHGTTAMVYMSFDNIGSYEWNKTAMYLLGTGDCAKFKYTKILMPTTIRCGERSTFTFPLVAPSTPGKYTLTYQMRYNSHYNFGDSKTIKVTVT
jgi:hypothetical protein